MPVLESGVNVTVTILKVLRKGRAGRKTGKIPRKRIIQKTGKASRKIKNATRISQRARKDPTTHRHRELHEKRTTHKCIKCPK
jgi:hypothetical protein